MLTLVNDIGYIEVNTNTVDLAKKHPNKEIQKAINYAIGKKWSIAEAGGSSHAWGRLKCPESSRSGCIISVWSTPRVPENHARQIIREVDKCSHS